MKPKVLVIVGPTASGKSDLAIKLARKLNGEIVSADSRQVYRGLNIGTGKITKKEMRGVPHYLLDIADVKERFTVVEYKELALNAIKFISKRNKLPIIVGGTGYYIDSLNINLPDVPPNKEFRKRLEKKSVEELFKILRKKDPRRAKTIDPKNKVRLTRALEIIQAIDKVPVAKKQKTEYEFLFVGIKPKDLESRIRRRLIKRIPGIIRETKKIAAKRAHELGLEYRFASLYLKGKLNRKEFIEKLNTAINQYSKRQMTWFKRNKRIRWFDSSDSAFRATIRELSGSRKRG